MDVVYVSDERYEQIALADPEGHWELHNGRLVAKPSGLGATDMREDRYERIALAVIPTALVRRSRVERPKALEVYEQPLPLVVEVWLPRTGAYDIDTKLAQYQLRGDEEIWRIHPIERTVTAWRRRGDGSYGETSIPGGTVRPVALPGVSIDLNALFDL